MHGTKGRLPNLIHGRYDHACGYYHHRGKVVSENIYNPNPNTRKTSKCLLSSACVRYTWWPGVRAIALVPSSTTLPPRPWQREPHAGWRGGRYPPPGWGSEGSPSGVEASFWTGICLGSDIIIFHPLADCIWPVSNEWRTNNIWTYRSVLQTKLYISTLLYCLSDVAQAAGRLKQAGWPTCCCTGPRRATGRRSVEFHILTSTQNHIVVIEEFKRLGICRRPETIMRSGL